MLSPGGAQNVLKTGELKKLAMRSKECATELGAQTGKCFLKIFISCFNPTHM